MKIPNYIKKKMHTLAETQRKAAELSIEIDDYFIKKGFNIEALRSGDGFSLEELDYGNDVTCEFCERIEKSGAKMDGGESDA